MSKMAGIDDKYLLRIMDQLQPGEFGQIKYILKYSFTGKSH